MEIQTVTHLPSQISALEKEAMAEGFKFITRLTSEWHSGANRFDAPGECLMGDAHRAAKQPLNLVATGQQEPFVIRSRP